MIGGIPNLFGIEAFTLPIVKTEHLMDLLAGCFAVDNYGDAVLGLPFEKVSDLFSFRPQPELSAFEFLSSISPVPALVHPST